MPLQIVPYEPPHEPAVAAFNERAQTHNAPFGLSKRALAAWLPKESGRPVYREFFLAIDGSDVRGGFTLRRQDFWLREQVRPAANYQGPLSEGLWDRRYMMSGVQMLRAALRDQPLLYALGMGGMQQPLPKLLASAGWALTHVPFFFRVLRPARFLRNLQPLRRSILRGQLLDLLAASGLGTLGIHLVQAIRTRARLPGDCQCEPVTTFGEWADTIWSEAKTRILFGAVRDRATQNALFGDKNPKNIILRCTHVGTDIGWAVVRSTPMQGDKYFGSMTVGSLVDCLALPGREPEVVALATRYLKRAGSDLVVSNQTHATWCKALGSNGYFSGPSNFLFASSPALTAELGSLEEVSGRLHFNRADGDGPIHL
ncbi:MAG: hypothetical protein EOP84_25340 [Verrucomicrobiaceae bacterium]|nr:MAG: hypothetical protein EOP84_25340 [Verrucomicrobiaceae bacterium]